MTSRPGLLFDLDGTLVETDPVHFAAFNDILSRNGRPTIDQHVYDSQIIGFQNADIFARLFPDRTVDEHVRLADEKEALFRSRAGELRPAEGLLDLLDWADGSGIPIAVVTNAPRANAAMMLESDKGQLAARLEQEQQERQVLKEAEERRRNEERRRLAAEAKAAAEVSRPI